MFVVHFKNLRSSWPWYSCNNSRMWSAILLELVVRSTSTLMKKLFSVIFDWSIGTAVVCFSIAIKSRFGGVGTSIVTSSDSSPSSSADAFGELRLPTAPPLSELYCHKLNVYYWLYWCLGFSGFSLNILSMPYNRIEYLNLRKCMLITKGKNELCRVKKNCTEMEIFYYYHCHFVKNKYWYSHK